MASSELVVLQDQWKHLRNRNLSQEAITICLAGVSKSTTSQYLTYLIKFKKFCDNLNIEDYLNPPLEIGIEFLTSLHKQGLSYSTINIARSMLSHYVHVQGLSKDVDFGKHALTTRFMKGIFKLNPPKSKHIVTWNVKKVLDLLRNKINSELTLKELSQKCLMLLALCTGQRAQTLTALNLDNLIKEENRFTFTFSKILKTSRPGFKHLVQICKFPNDSVICPLECLIEYLKRTSNIRQSKQLFVSFQKPHSCVSTQTISRWLTNVLRQAGIIQQNFTAHSIRGAAASKAAETVEINTILKTVGWSQEDTFAKFYHRMEAPEHRKAFTQAVLT